MKKKIKLISCCLILAIFASTAIYIIVMMMSDEKIGGANMNSFCYVNDILPCKYSSLEKAMQAVIEEEFEQVLCTVENNSVIHVFLKGEEIYKENDKIIDNVTYICCYDFLEKDDYYIFCGKRSLSIGDSEAYTKYSWQETMLADMFISKSFLYKKAIQKKYNALPAWGVSDNSKIESVTVDG